MCRVIKIYSPSRPEIGSYYLHICNATPEEYLMSEKKAYKQANREPDKYYQTLAHPIIAVGDAKIEVVVELPEDSDAVGYAYNQFQEPPDAIRRPADIITAISPRHNLIEPYRRCECGSYISVKYLSRHVKTAVHNRRMEELELLTPDERETMREYNNKSEESRRQFRIPLDADSSDDDDELKITPRMCLCTEVAYNIDSHYKTKKHKEWVANRRAQLESEGWSLAGSSGRVSM